MSFELVNSQREQIEKLFSPSLLDPANPLVAMIAAQSEMQVEQAKTDAVDLRVKEQMLSMLKALSDENAALNTELQVLGTAGATSKAAKEARIKALEELNAKLTAEKTAQLTTASNLQAAYNNLQASLTVLQQKVAADPSLATMMQRM